MDVTAARGPCPFDLDYIMEAHAHRDKSGLDNCMSPHASLNLVGSLQLLSLLAHTPCAWQAFGLSRVANMMVTGMSTRESSACSQRAFVSGQQKKKTSHCQMCSFLVSCWISGAQWICWIFGFNMGVLEMSD